MTREEAISVLKMVEAHGLADEAKKMAIEALQTELNCKNCVFRMGYGTGIDEGVLNALPKKMEEGE